LKGARWPGLSGDGTLFPFVHDGDLAPLAPGNRDRGQEVFLFRGGPGVEQLTDTGRSGGSPRFSATTASEDGRRVAFVSTSDLAGNNADGSAEVFVWDAALGFIQVTDGPAGTSAEGAALSSDGGFAVFWDTADLTGDNPDTSLELFRAAVDGGHVDQLTDLTGSPYHSLPTIAGHGSRAAFILEADLTGDNADGSWELFMWQGPPGPPGAAASFRQVTDWHPPMTGRDIHDPSMSDDGRRIAFTGRGHVDVSQPSGHSTYEIYLWSEGTGIQRITTATAADRSSNRPRISLDGTHVVFVSLSDFDPGAPGNADRNAELFMWSDCDPIDQITASAGHPSVVLTDPSVNPATDREGTRVTFVSEAADDVGPLVLGSRRGVAFESVEDPATPCRQPGPTSTVTPTVTSTATAAPGTTPSSVPPTPSSPPTAVPIPTSAHGASVCPQMVNRIPAPIQAYALANPEEVYGWFLPRNPARPPGPLNPMRRWLSLRDPGKPYSWANPAVWKAGCP
jgi:Tol biopolymer transport system component